MQIVSIFTSDGVCVARVARIASSFCSRLVGLLNRSYLHRQEALLLSPGGSIHTIGMRFPLDVLFLDVDMHILRKVERMPPWRGAVAPAGTAHVLELRAGRAAELRLSAGKQLHVLHSPAESATEPHDVQSRSSTRSPSCTVRTPARHR